ncbi:Calcium/calmodulin-dependent/calcium-dependent protein kinase [Penicillium canariense]|uniref:Calcium/calmodulin-dependent/calcium-dependent protein kinase n=1 Tax=Penicillium canariense TaxID=189055 RepID=A0A9W9HXP1_9EURO|nr:Calcium/calmodulin-dependent/calcium-dependent protein kinase [Penicillium canariense]KAJ5160904.1 Calcium/calmodulin-dependent/calcium-dependent protein kinase [Penicillium canariense]
MVTPESGPTARSGLAIICPRTPPSSHDAASSPSSSRNAGAPALYAPSAPVDVPCVSNPSTPGLPSLQIRTDLPDIRPTSSHHDSDPLASISLSGSLPRRTPSLRALVAPPISSAGSLSPASFMSSPQLNAMGDITPLPSPIGGALPWRRGDVPSLSRTSSNASRSGSSLRLSDSSQMLGPPASRSHGKSYNGLDNQGEESPSNRIRRDSPTKHARNRSLSDYVPPGRMSIPRPVAVSGAGPSIAPSSSTDSKSTGLQREQYLAVHRGIALPNVRPPSPPRSSGSAYGYSDAEPVIHHPAPLSTREEIYSVKSVRTQQARIYRKIRVLGQGTFSQVSLAARVEQVPEAPLSPDTDRAGEAAPIGTTQKLVAVKIIEHGPAGGADEERLEVSLKREVDILKSVNHPSLVQLKAFGSDEKRALLVLDYCPGGDLFEFATSGHQPMSPGLIRRIFAELLDAVRYLHSNYIVHRDIKLENVLLTMPIHAVESVEDWSTYDRAVVTLSDLGLSRRIPEPPESPLLQTRCGSEDYAAPEILMGQPYDGRATDAWALGVLLYAIMENRLPFDVLPGTRGDPAKLRARTPHRIARCEWSWYRYANEDEEWDPEKAQGLDGAQDCVEGLLKRNTKRKTLDQIAAIPWVRDAINVPAGLKRGDKEVP